MLSKQYFEATFLKYCKKRNAGILIKHFSTLYIHEWNFSLTCLSNLLLIMHIQLLIWIKHNFDKLNTLLKAELHAESRNCRIFGEKNSDKPKYIFP